MGVKESLKKKKSILHIVVWILALIALALIGDLECFKCFDTYSENQFIDATIFGYFIIICILVLEIFLEEEFPPKALLAVCILGAVMYLITAILLCTYLNDTYFGPGHNFDDLKGRTMAAMILCIFLGILYLFEFIVDLAKPEILKD